MSCQCALAGFPPRDILARRIDLLHCGDLAILVDELDNHVSEFRNTKLKTLVRNKLLVRRTQTHDVQSAAWFEYHLKSCTAGGHVSARDSLRRRLIKPGGPAHKGDFALIQ